MTGQRRVAAIAIALSAAALAVAWGSETFGGLVPCALCLWERTPYWAALGCSACALALSPRWACAALLLGAAALFAGAGIGAVHVGVEHGWWPSPLPECAVPRLGGGSLADRFARMPAIPAKPCDDPTYVVPGLPVSMAAMNLILALALSAGLAISAMPTRRRT